MSKAIHRMVVIAALMMLSLSILSMLSQGPDDHALADETGGPPQLSTSYMYLKPPNGLSPEVPDIGNNDLTATIPNGFVQDGPFGRGILPFIGHVEWREVGVWTTSPVKETINLGGMVTVKMWAKGNPSNQNSVTCSFEFIISRANEANAIVQLSRSNVRVPSGTSGEFVSFEATAALPPGNATTIEANGQLSIRVRAQCNGGAILVYGTQSHDSGFMFDSNALRPHNLIMDRSSITLEYKDAFLVPYTKMHKRLVVNDIEVENREMDTDFNTENQTRLLIWPRDNNPGSYQLSVSLSYDPTGDRNVSMANVIRIQIKQKDTGEWIRSIFSAILPYLIIILVVILLLVLNGKRKKRMWRRRLRQLPEADRNLPLKKQKRAWKKHRKEETNRKKAERQERRKRLEDEDAEAGFSLFKKRPEGASKPGRRARSGGAVQVVEEIEAPSGEERKIEDLSELDL